MTSSRDVKVLSAEKSYSPGNDSIEFLDLKNLENDTNKVACTTSTTRDTIHDTLTSCMTSSRDVKVLSADRIVLEMIPLNFLTSKTYKITPKTLLYDFYSL